MTSFAKLYLKKNLNDFNRFFPRNYPTLDDVFVCVCVCEIVAFNVLHRELCIDAFEWCMIRNKPSDVVYLSLYCIVLYYV